MLSMMKKGWAFLI
uniref:Uncharacterized protein n=1 Tax=Lepeophtheirus salmonis TaxID=72036 RepID=A0A0K2VJ91_LEPSM